MRISILLIRVIIFSKVWNYPGGILSDILFLLDILSIWWFFFSWDAEFDPMIFFLVDLIMIRWQMLKSILKSRNITLPTKGHLIKAIVFPVVMYECESWTIKKTEHWRELMLLSCGVGEDSWESFRLQGNPTSPSKRK